MSTKNSQFGTKWINNGMANRKIKINDLLPDGWSYGRVHVHTEEGKRTISEKCKAAAVKSSKKRLETIQEKYGSFMTESRERAIKKYWDQTRSSKLNEPFDRKSNHYKRLQILQEQNNSCLNCKLSEWLGNKIKFELDHIDGNTKNNSRENLRMLCPNCHSFTDTWRKKKNIADVA